jgi:SPP1 gp7 family putative phage head morphogenesis protein
MSNATIARRIKSTDELISQFEGKTISAVESAMNAAFRRLEREFRRKWVEVEGLDISGQNRAILLIEQIKSYLEILPSDSGAIEKLYEDLVKDSQIAGIDFGASAIESITGFTAATVKPNLKAIAYQSQDASKRLYRHSTDFQLAASRVIQQGLVGGSGVAKVAEQLRRELGVTKSKAESIARTESMSATDSATRDTYRKNGIEYVQRIGTQDKRICPICAARAGNVYPADKAPAILHPRDRCYNAPFSPAWVELGLVDMAWLQNHRAESIAALGDKSPDYGPSPFERMAGQLPIKPIWTVDRGFAAGFESISADDDFADPLKDLVPPQPEPAPVAKPKAVPQYKQYIERGRETTKPIAQKLAALDAAVQLNQNRFDLANDDFDRVFTQLDDFTAALNTPEGQEWDAADTALKRSIGARNRGIAEEMTRIRLAMLANASPVPTSKIPVTKEAEWDLTGKEIKSVVQDFARIVGGRGVGMISKIARISDRANADPIAGVLNVGKNGTANRAREVVFHELAHFIEFENPSIGAAAIEWVKSRATGPLTKLADLAPANGYDDDEVAYPDRFIDPYIGKSYGAAYFTEVVSMGVEHFASPEMMEKLYLADPEHFEFILGVLAND